MSNLDNRNMIDLQNAFELADQILLKKHIYNIDQYPIRIDAPDGSTQDICGLDGIMIHEPIVNRVINQLEVGSNVRLYKIKKLIYDKQENIHDKLVAVYSSIASGERQSLVVLLNGFEDCVDLYIGVVIKSLNRAGSVDGAQRKNVGDSLKGLLTGYFAGTEVELVKSSETADLILSSMDQIQTIASVSGIANIRDEKKQNDSFVQGMEKLIDSMRGKRYAALYIADAMSVSEIESICARYEDLYATLSPFKQSVHTLNRSDTVTDTSSVVEGIVDTTNEAISEALSHGTTTSITKTNTIGVGAHTGVKLGPVNVGASVNYSHSDSKTNGEYDTVTRTQTTGSAHSLTKQNSVAQALAKGNGESLQITYDNRAVRTLLERIDEQIKRLRSCEDYGLFNSCVYFLADQYATAVSAATAYKSMIRGDNSSVESSAINIWTDPKTIEKLSVYLRRFYHPEFGLPIVLPNREKGERDVDEYVPKKYYINVSPALMISGKELSYQFSLPKKSVSGLPVISCAEFGRNVLTTNGAIPKEDQIKIGKIHHMQEDEAADAILSVKELRSHVFITGSTGSGKSNTVYQLLHRIREKTKVFFMVIEPAKGEYKDVFGNNSDVFVYGSNPKLTPILRINPFKFPDHIHVYEHMDRLIEIFNVCWPMYAAMPAVLKAAIEQAYVSAGWDLEQSINVTGTNIYPSFSSVATEVKRYLDSSEYSDENKGNYKGALLTRLESLTNGINSMIFTSDDLSDHDLYDRNVIVDLSRIGSTETKALIMGVLVMRMQEYRSGSSDRNNDLKHVTVLEEAHHLLKRTSTEQSAEGSNLLGKSVEMLSNSIAEMRTYGESFVIVDQSPGLMDMSVIRNTNTKIILRLPDYSDRELVGRSASLNRDQIDEIAKLKTGVAAVYQNNWISPILCHFQEFLDGNTKYDPHPETRSFADRAVSEVLDIIMNTDILYTVDDADLKHDIAISKLPDSLKVLILKYLNGEPDQSKVKQIAKIAYRFFQAEDTLDALSRAQDIDQWKTDLIDRLNPSVKEYPQEDVESLLALLLHEHYLTHKAYEPIYISYMKYLDDVGRMS